jgi:hypothetical protein
MSTKQRFHVATSAARHRFNLSNCPSPANDGDSLATVFNRIQKVCEIASGFSGTDFGHLIRLSDKSISHTP